jgi:hypothetical protein
MWTTLALMTTLTMAPAQAGEPEIKNSQFTYGILGQVRKDDKFLPGDTVFLTFETDGMKVRDDGRVLYSQVMEVYKKGQTKPVLRRELDSETTNVLGKGTFRAWAIWQVPRDTDSPGEYTLKLTLKDRATGKSATHSKKFEVKKTELGFVQLRLLAPQRDEMPVPPVCVAGQKILLHHWLVGFQSDPKEKQVSVAITIRVLDESGQPTLVKPFKGDVKGDEKDAPGIMVLLPYPMDLNRPGKFKIELSAVCNVSGKKAKETLDLTVLDTK